MYGSHVVSTDYWRYHKPFAPDLEFDVVIGRDVFIDMKPYWLQGARDYDLSFSPDPEVLIDPISPDPEYTLAPYMVPVQRGWLLDMLLSVPGRKGIVLPSERKDGFTYKPNISAVSGTDCFNYQFSNGVQASNYGKITLNLIQPFKIDWDIFARSDRVYYPDNQSFNYRMRINATPAHPDYVTGRLQVFRWRVVGPVVEDRNGVPTVFIRDRIIHETRFWTYYTHVTYYDTGKDLTYRNFRDDSNLAGIMDARTNAPYIPTMQFPRVYVEFLNYPRIRRSYWGGYYYSDYIDRSYVERFIYRIEDFFGPRWWRSGKIKIE